MSFTSITSCREIKFFRLLIAVTSATELPSSYDDSHYCRAACVDQAETLRALRCTKPSCFDFYSSGFKLLERSEVVLQASLIFSNMHSTLAFLTVLTNLVTTTPIRRTDKPASECSADDLQCCQNTGTIKDLGITPLLVLTAPLSPILMLVVPHVLPNLFAAQTASVSCCYLSSFWALTNTGFRTSGGGHSPFHV
uniref:Hydrophobin n=1 Tax=Moniliophthora roreri TaxID=221103 RepID=A0A0W0G8D0_MONRR